MENIAMTKMATIPENYNKIPAGIVEPLKTAHSPARRVNSLMTAAYWQIGRRIAELNEAGSTVLNTLNT